MISQKKVALFVEGIRMNSGRKADHHGNCKKVAKSQSIVKETNRCMGWDHVFLRRRFGRCFLCHYPQKHISFEFGLGLSLTIRIIYCKGRESLDAT